METYPISSAGCIVRNTGARKGRTQAVAPGLVASRHLHYGRIVLDAGDAPLRFNTAGLETGVIALRGSASIQADGRAFTLDRYDALYVPRDTEVEIVAGSDGCDLAEIAAPVEGKYP